MKQKSLFLSVIIPVYNESARLSNIKTIYTYLEKKNFPWEIILVNDGSHKKYTQELLLMCKPLSKVQIISYEKNRGKGYAVKTGMLKASGKYRLFTDIDLSTPITSLDQITQNILNGDIVIGSRKIKGSHVVRHQALMREQMGKIFTLLSQVILKMPVSDFTCGFKCFSSKSAEAIFQKSKISRWGFDSEILFIGHKLGFSIKEIPITWENDPNSKVRIPRDVITSLTDLFLICYNDKTGKYNARQ